jgi:hypothetical protein
MTRKYQRPTTYEAALQSSSRSSVNSDNVNPLAQVRQQHRLVLDLQLHQVQRGSLTVSVDE